MTDAGQSEASKGIKRDPELTIKGFLTKKSSGLFKSSRSRYWRVDQSGLRLYYYLNNDKESLSRPCNFYNIEELNVEEGTCEEEFVLKTPESTLTLRADTEEQKRMWMRSIFVLKKRIHEARKQEKKEAKSDHTLTTSSASPDKAPRGSKLRVMSSLRVKSEVLPLDMAALEQLELASYLRFLPAGVAEHNILCGHIGIVKGNYFPKIKQRFFMLFSSKSLYPDKHVSEHFLLDSQLPPWLQVNSLYEIDLKKKSRDKLFHVKSMLGTTSQDDESKSEGQYLLEINVGQKMTVQLAFDIVALRDRWRQLLELAKKNASEVEKNGGGYIKRNVDLLLRELNSKQLEQRLQQLYDEIRPKQYEYTELVTFLRRVETEFEQIREAVLAKQPKELDLLHFYFDFFHDKVFLQTKLCWDSHFEKMSTLQMVQLLKWIDQYCIKFEQEVQDTRFIGGVRALLKIFGRRVWNSLKPMVVAVVQNDKADNFFEEDGVVYSNSIVDLFKLINDSFHIYKQQYASKPVARMLGHVTRLCVDLYLKSMQETVDESMIGQQQLAAISNNVIWFNRFLKEFIESKLVPHDIDESDATEITQYAKLTKMYSDITSVTRTKLASSVNSKVAKFYQSRRYPQALLDNVVAVINENIGIVESLHDVNKRAFWKIVLQFLVGEIIRSLATNAAEKRKENREASVAKLHNEIQIIRAEFGSLVLQVTLKANISRLENVIVVLTSTDPETIMNIIKSEDYKPILKVSVMVKLLDYRRDLSKGTIDILNSEIKHIQDDSDSPNTRRREKSRRTRKTIVLNMREVSDQSFEQDDEELPQHEDTLISEGYMLKKKSDRKLWQKRYFRIAEGVLYWYQDKQSPTCQNQIPLVEVTEVYASNPLKMTFYIKWAAYGMEKEYKFKCNSVQERQNWMRSIIATVNGAKEKPKAVRKPKKIQEKATLFVDYEGINDPDDDFEDVIAQPKSPSRSNRNQPNSPTKAVRKEQLVQMRQTWKEANIKPIFTGRQQPTSGHKHG